MPIRYEPYKKYKNKKCTCNQNHVHKSRGEAGYCDQLFLEWKAGEFKDYEVEKQFDLTFPGGGKICAHKPDFLIHHFDGSKEVREYKSKGTVTQLWKLKKALFQFCYPDIPYNVIWHKKTRWSKADWMKNIKK